ncbi:MAG: sodium-dependent transporter [Thiohalomonadaceae bacterium]
MPHREHIHGQWSSRWAFILAATGSAVGLGNIWKFPYITGENGGGAFVLVYLGCIALIGIPIMVGEIMLGRRGRRSPINAMRYLAREEGVSPHWQLLGWWGVLAGIVILSFYSVIAGWSLAYVVRGGGGAFTGLDGPAAQGMFGSLVADPERLLAWHTIFVVMTVVVVSRGVAAGLEKAVRFMMPALFLILLLLLGYAMNTGSFLEGVRFMFRPDFGRLTMDGVLTAMGHSFFTLSLGMGAIMVYGSYLPRRTSIVGTTVLIAAADTLVALLAGLAIFPIVFANGLPPGAGPGLVFQTLPIAFGNMPGGSFFGTLFFVLLVFAAWTSAISLVEPAVAWLVENHNITRVNAAAFAGGLGWLLGLGTIFSFNLWSDAPYQLFGKTVFDLLDYLATNVMLPLGGLLIAVFAGWFMSRRSSVEELGIGDAAIYRGWRFLIRYISPVLIALVFLRLIGVIQFN